MFSFQMVSKEIAEVFNEMSLARSAAYEAVISSSQIPNETQAENKLNDLKSHLREVQRQLKELDSKIEYIKNQS